MSIFSVNNCVSSFIMAGVFLAVPSLSDVLVQLSVKSRKHIKTKAEKPLSFFIVVTGKPKIFKQSKT